jgi:aspartyl-tRNA(Asn)/glutamyl-tRNA(Gln) amidotransferase subunit B
MMMSELEYRVVVGLEIHVQLCTQSKLFCGCAVEFGQAANSRVCPVCLGMPGVLPVMNKKAYEYSVLAALALNCDIAAFTKWDRKSYYYPDLPKNFQTSQYDLPLSSAGYIEIPRESGDQKRIRITRALL